MNSKTKINFPESFKRGLWQGVGIAIGMFTSSLVAVAVSGTVTWSGGQTLTAADLNATINGLVTAVTNIPDWSKNGANAVYTAGNVGIGTNSPTQTLHLHNASQPVLQLTSASGTFSLGVNNTETWINSLSNPLLFQVNGSERMRIDSIGNVGIGTTAMNSKLSILAPTSGLQVGATNFTPQANTMFSVNSEDNSVSSFIAQFGSLNAGIRMSIRSDGSVFIPGSLSKGSGTFDIPHPDPSMPKDSHLRHSFVESPTAGDNIYRWQVKIESENGQSYIQLPKYWRHLNENPMVWVSSADEPALAYGYVNMSGDKIIVQANKIGSYNVLLLGTRKDQIAISSWKQLGMEYISNGIGNAKEILTFNNKTETGVYETKSGGSDRKMSLAEENRESTLVNLRKENQEIKKQFSELKLSVVRRLKILEEKNYETR